MHPPRWFELVVRLTAPGGKDFRLVVLMLAMPVAGFGFGKGLVETPASGSASTMKIAGGVCILAALAVFVVAYAVTLADIARADRLNPVGRHAQRHDEGCGSSQGDTIER